MKVEQAARESVKEWFYVRHLQKTVRALRRELANERQSNEAYRLRLGALEARLRRDG